MHLESAKQLGGSGSGEWEQGLSWQMEQKVAASIPGSSLLWVPEQDPYPLLLPLSCLALHGATPLSVYEWVNVR